MKCRAQRTALNVQAVYTINGKPASQGVCAVCGTTIFKMGVTEAHAAVAKPAPLTKTELRAARKAAARKITAKKATVKKAAVKKAVAPNKATDTKKTAAKKAVAPKKATSTSGTADTSAATPAKKKVTRKTTGKAASKTIAGKATSKAAAKGGIAKRSTAKRGGAKNGVKAEALPPIKSSAKLVIVESPAKARTVGNFLGKGYTVLASKGHVRDLLKSQLSVDVNNNFEPKYRVPNDRREQVKQLAGAAASAKEIFLATDPDREGEAIAWHLIAATEMDTTRLKRVVFHEITQTAIDEAFNHPRAVDMHLVNAQQARRILDRLVGYPITELLWSKVRNQLSAGRVQSVALRMVVDREREIEAFTPIEYWTVDARLHKRKPATAVEAKPFMAHLLKINGAEIDFSRQDQVQPHLDVLVNSMYIVHEVKQGTRQRKPSPPFTTSTLQQEASRRLGFGAQRTMKVAQGLYEGVELAGLGAVGLITYMRTDSTHVATQAQEEARAYIQDKFGPKYVPPKAPEYKTKSKNAQEAHEAIRPTSVLREPNALKEQLTAEQFKLYQLIWQRFVASQMENAVFNTLRVDINAGPNAKTLPYLFRVAGSTIKFHGFLALYEDTRDEDTALDDDEGRILPPLVVGETLDLLNLLPEQHFTQPPPRFTEATLVQALEEYGIGRPSTYAATLETLQEKDRDYVQKTDKRLIPTKTGRTVSDLLVQYFPDVMDPQFTARMEDKLDTIAEGELEWHAMLNEFYGNFATELDNARANMPRTNVEEPIGRACPLDGADLVVRYGRFGKFIGCSNYPTCRHTEPWLERKGIACPKCGATEGGEVVQRKNAKGRTFYGCARYPACDFAAWHLPKPVRATQDGDSEQAVELDLVGAAASAVADSSTTPKRKRS
jgi:DNA topoisomerase I